MKIAALRERAKNERRAAITPQTAKLLINKGFRVCVEKNIGSAANFSDQEYINAGAEVSNVPLEIISDADIILKVQPTPLIDSINEIDLSTKKAIIIGLLSPEQNQQYINSLKEKNLYGIAMEKLPRITKAQNMDVLSSQSNLAGYRAVIEASYHFGSAFPMMMTAAGTINPAKVLILGAGVAGLQAIATAKRIGAIVSAYDVRSATKEQVESLGAKFVTPSQNEDLEDKSGYAKEVTNEYKAKQDQFLQSIIKNYDIVITTAQIPGKRAPILINSAMIKLMKDGAIIVDMATISGGNVEGSIIDEIIIKEEVKIIGCSNYASLVPSDSSKLYAKNLYNFLIHAIQNNQFNLNDEIVKPMVV